MPDTRAQERVGRPQPLNYEVPLCANLRRKEPQIIIQTFMAYIKALGKESPQTRRGLYSFYQLNISSVCKGKEQTIRIIE